MSDKPQFRPEQLLVNAQRAAEALDVSDKTFEKIKKKLPPYTWTVLPGMTQPRYYIPGLKRFIEERQSEKG